MESFTLLEHDEVAIRASLHRAQMAAPATIVYIHGGGCIYGQRDDLPQPYIELLTSHGYNLIALDYLLAPESKLEEILDILYASLRALRERTGDDPGIGDGPYILMGRSAGAFLAIQVIARLIDQGDTLPVALLDFYGYSSLDAKEFWTENRYYGAFARVDDRTYDAAVGTRKLAEGPLSTRYSAYVYHRQRGTWPEAVLGDMSPAEVIIPDDVLARFPPTLLVHSIYDQDVPFRCAKDLARKLPEATLVKVYDSDLHDFDRDPDVGLPIYRRAVEWLASVHPGQG